MAVATKKREKTCLSIRRLDDRSATMQAFTPIGVTVAEIAVRGQTHTHTKLHHADDISDKTHSLLALRFPDNDMEHGPPVCDS